MTSTVENVQQQQSLLTFNKQKLDNVSIIYLNMTE